MTRGDKIGAAIAFLVLGLAGLAGFLLTALVVWFAFNGLHEYVEAVPAIPYKAALFVTLLLGVVSGALRK